MKIQYARGEIRTHEAYALELETNPFDHSGTLAFTTCVKTL